MSIIAEPTLNPFDPASLRLGQDFAASLGVKKALLLRIAPEKIAYAKSKGTLA